MKRKMVWLGIPWLIGLYFAATCQISVTTSLLLAAFLLLGAFRLYRRITTAQMLTAGLSAAAAVGAVLLYTTMVYQPLLAHAGTITTFSGRVTTVTTYDNDRASYQLKGQFRDGKKAKILVYTDDVDAQYGDTLDVAGTFSVPSDSYLWNTGSYYKAKGIFLQADTKDYISCTHTENGKLIRALQAYRSRISMRICTLAGTDAGGMVSAMLLGTKETLSEETDALLTHHGIRHVVSVSGLHLVLILSIWGFLCRKLHFHRWLTFGTTAVWTALYALMVGAPISILRAGFMFLMMQSAPLFFRKADTSNSLCIAGILMTIGNPYLIQDASFLLSYTGTFAVGVFAPWMTRKMRKKGFEWSLFRQLTTVTCVSVCIFPVTLLYFREVSVASPIANLLLVPICSLMLMLSLAIFLTGGVGIIAKPVCFCLKLLYDGMMLLGYGLRTLIPVMFPTGWKQLPLLSSILILFVLTVICFRRNRRTAAASIAVSFGILRRAGHLPLERTAVLYRYRPGTEAGRSGTGGIRRKNRRHRSDWRPPESSLCPGVLRRTRYSPFGYAVSDKASRPAACGLSADVVGNDRRRNGSSCQLLDSAGCRLYGNKTAANGQVCRGGHPVQHPGIGRHTAGEVRQPLFLCRDSRFLSSGRRGRRSDLYPVERRPGANAGRNL